MPILSIQDVASEHKAPRFRAISRSIGVLFSYHQLALQLYPLYIYKMAAQVGLTWENNPYNPALFGVNQALPAPANVYAPALTPTGAAYTWITDQGLTADELEVDLVLGPGKDLADVTLDLARVYSYILRDIFTHDPQQIAVSTRQLVNLIRCVTRRFILPVRNLLRAVNPRPARYQPLNLLLIVMENYIPEVGNPLGPYEFRNWVSTKSHLELALETFIARNNNWAALRPGLFVAPDRTLVDLQLAPPLPTRTGWFTFERNMVNARRSASPFVLSITEGPPPAPPAPGNGRVLAGASLPKADGYELLRNWACAARMQRYEALICNNINNALTSRDQPVNNIHNNRIGPNRNLAGFQNAVVAYKGV